MIPKCCAFTGDPSALLGCGLSSPWDNSPSHPPCSQVGSDLSGETLPALLLKRCSHTGPESSVNTRELNLWRIFTLMTMSESSSYPWLLIKITQELSKTPMPLSPLSGFRPQVLWSFVVWAIFPREKIIRRQLARMGRESEATITQ